MLAHCPQNSSARYVKHLHDPIIPSSYYKLSILPELCTSSRVLEPRDGLDDLACFGRIDENSRGGADSIAMWPCRAEMDMGDGRWVLDEEGMAEGVEMAGVRSEA
jgi:hypothetical protein